jgi:ribose transport system substrate-binding protein
VIVSELDGGGLKDIAFKATEDTLQASPNIKGIFAINDPTALGAYAALEKSGKAGSVVLVGFDGQPEGKQAILEGKIYADPIQYPDKMGQEVVAAIVKHSKGEAVEPIILIPTQLYRQSDAAAQKSPATP